MNVLYSVYWISEELPTRTLRNHTQDMTIWSKFQILSLVYILFYLPCVHVQYALLTSDLIYVIIYTIDNKNKIK